MAERLAELSKTTAAQAAGFIDDTEPLERELFGTTTIRILVIDRSSVQAQVVAASLTHPGVKIDTTSQAKDAEAKLSATSYHMVIAEFGVPGLAPAKLLGLLKEHQADASVVVTTANPSLDDAVACLRAQVVDYLPKPVDLANLSTVVRKSLEARGLLRLSEDALRCNLGLCLRERRRGLGLTLAQLADRTKVSLGYLSQIELGKNSASIETLYRICLGLQIKISELFSQIRA